VLHIVCYRLWSWQEGGLKNDHEAPPVLSRSKNLAYQFVWNGKQTVVVSRSKQMAAVSAEKQKVIQTVMTKKKLSAQNREKSEKATESKNIEYVQNSLASAGSQNGGDGGNWGEIKSYQEVTKSKGDFPLPSYPARAQHRGEEGRVVVGLKFAKGTVKEIALLQSSGIQSLDLVTLSTLKNWRFHEGSDVNFQQEVIFKLD
jgi:TonB family protein